MIESILLIFENERWDRFDLFQDRINLSIEKQMIEFPTLLPGGWGWGNWVGLHGQWEAGYGYLVRIRLDHHVWMGGGGGRTRGYRIFFYIFGYTMLSFTLRKCEMFKNCLDLFANHCV